MKDNADLEIHVLLQTATCNIRRLKLHRHNSDKEKAKIHVHNTCTQGWKCKTTHIPNQKVKQTAANHFIHVSLCPFLSAQAW